MKEEPDPANRPFDVFLSYKSEDIAWVRRLKESLQARGVAVWIDEEQIRPGDRFAESLEAGLETTKAMVLVVTPESIESNWVREEYYRALSLANANRLRIIPIILRKAVLPGFLEGRQYVDFSDDSIFERQVDKLVWPGLTGKRLVVIWLRTEHSRHSWTRLHQRGWAYVGRGPIRNVNERTEMQIEMDPRDGFQWWDDPRFPHSPSRHVVFVNLFEASSRGSQQGRSSFSPSQYAQFIFRLRELTKDTRDEVVFVLYHRQGALRQASELSPENVERFSHYFTLTLSDSGGVARREFNDVWCGVQRLLIHTERT